MKDQNIISIPVYPEGRECSSPTAYRILSKFDNIVLNHLLLGGREVKTVHPELSNVQKQIICLLNIQEEKFWPDQ